MADDNAKCLLDLARKRFGVGDEKTLRPADEKLFTAVGSGIPANFLVVDDERTDDPEYDPADEPVNDPANAADWGDGRTIPPDRIVWLCSDRDAKELVTHRGINIGGAKISGALDLTDVDCSWRLGLLNCVLPAGLVLDNASLRSLSLTGSHVSGVLNADGAREDALSMDHVQIKGTVFLSNGFEAKGNVRLLGATIGGTFVCRGGKFINPGKNAKTETDALSMEGAQIRGDVFLNTEFRAVGAVRLLGATIGGTFDCRGGKFINPGKDALSMDRVQIKGTVFLSNGFEAKGNVRLLGATIGDTFVCRGGKFINPGKNAKTETDALSMDGAQIKGSVFLDAEFRAVGKVRLLGATIGGSFACRGGKFINPGKDALSMEGAQIKGHVLLDHDFQATGTVSLMHAHVLGGVSLDIKALDFKLDATSVHVEQIVRMIGRGAINADWQHARVDGLFECALANGDPEVADGADSGVLDMRSAKVGTFRFRLDQWPARKDVTQPPVRLQLSGFQYDAFEIQENGRKTELRYEDWVQLQYQDAENTFYPQPYNQLAAVLRQQGRGKNARDVLVAKNDDRTTYAEMGYWAEHRLRMLGRLVRYGYYPLHSLLFAVAVIFVGSLMFFLADYGGLIKEVDAPKGGVRAGGAFSSLMYSVDCFVPIVNFDQRTNFRPDSAAGTGSYWWPGHRESYGEIRQGGAVLIYYWIHIALGWFLSTVFVSGLAGLIRR